MQISEEWVLIDDEMNNCFLHSLSSSSSLILVPRFVINDYLLVILNALCKQIKKRKENELDISFMNSSNHVEVIFLDDKQNNEKMSIQKWNKYHNQEQYNGIFCYDLCLILRSTKLENYQVCIDAMIWILKSYIVL